MKKVTPSFSIIKSLFTNLNTTLTNIAFCIFAYFVSLKVITFQGSCHFVIFVSKWKGYEIWRLLKWTQYGSDTKAPISFRTSDLELQIAERFPNERKKPLSPDHGSWKSLGVLFLLYRSGSVVPPWFKIWSVEINGYIGIRTILNHKEGSKFVKIHFLGHFLGQRVFTFRDFCFRMGGLWILKIVRENHKDGSKFCKNSRSETIFLVKRSLKNCKFQGISRLLTEN